jgi:exodeoxyribonuclease III
MQKKFKIMSWNLNGIRACLQKGMAESVAAQSPDILCVQETKAHPDQVGDGIQHLKFSHQTWASALKKGYSGVATFSNIVPREIYPGRGIPKYDNEGRTVISDYGKFLLYNIYFPNGGSGPERHAFKQEFLYELNGHLEGQLKMGKPIVVVGDYNVAHREIDVHDPVRLSKESGFLPEEREWFDKFLALGMVDIYREQHPKLSQKYSWWSYREFARVNNRGWRIDYICVSENLRSNVKETDILDNVTGSDHCPVIATLEF